MPTWPVNTARRCARSIASLVGCLCLNLQSRYQELRLGEEELLSLDRRRQAWTETRSTGRERSWSFRWPPRSA